MARSLHSFAWLDPRRQRTATQRGLALLVIVAALGGLAMVLVGQTIERPALDGVEVCAAEATDDCLAEASGRVDARRSSDDTVYYFETDDGERERLGEGRRFRDTATVLYRDDDLVAAVDPDGERTYLSAASGLNAWTGGAMVAFGVTLAAGFALRRSHVGE